ncbi:MAG: c-type cytochrome [Mariprofundus sp.]
MRIKTIICIVWAVIVPGQAVAADAVAGRQIFEQSCAYCHRDNYDEKFGPGLAGVMERRDAVWIDKFLQNPAEMIKSDEYAQTLKEGNEYGLTMPTLPQMQDKAKRQDVIEYLKTIQ